MSATTCLWKVLLVRAFQSFPQVGAPSHSFSSRGHITIELIAAMMIVSLSLGAMMDVATWTHSRGVLLRTRSQGLAQLDAALESLESTERKYVMEPIGSLVGICRQVSDGHEIFWIQTVNRESGMRDECRYPGTYLVERMRERG